MENRIFMKMNEMGKCFVIQPFDNDIYDKRYSDTFEPAIKKGGLEAYRIDKDLSVRIPIDDIEKGIRDADICFAEISTDNPNVWYELGYAFACSKDVVMVCSEDRKGGFPFDIQHRQIIKYQLGSRSDFDKLEQTIAEKIKALLHKSKTVQALSITPVIDTEGLKSYEVALLIILMENAIAKSDSYSIFRLKEEMGKAGYTDIATSIGVRTLEKNGYIEVFPESDYNGNVDYYCRVTDLGENWIINNQDQLVFRKESRPTAKPSNATDDLPF
jgi:hypothetical protein